jgi:hypothetical protein
MKKTEAQRAAKRRGREDRPKKDGTWRCRCGKRHPLGERCPIPRRELVAPYGTPLGGLEIGVLAALAAADRRKR